MTAICFPSGPGDHKPLPCMRLGKKLPGSEVGPETLKAIFSFADYASTDVVPTFSPENLPGLVHVENANPEAVGRRKIGLRQGRSLCPRRRGSNQEHQCG